MRCKEEAIDALLVTIEKQGAPSYMLYRGSTHLQVKQEIEAVLRGGHSNKEGELCVQAIFSLLDVLKKFVADLKDHAARDEGKLCFA